MSNKENDKQYVADSFDTLFNFSQPTNVQTLISPRRSFKSSLLCHVNVYAM